MFARSFLAASASVLSMTIASAADLPSRRGAPAYVAPVPIFSWTGAYIGVNAGFGFSDAQAVNTVGNNGTGAAAVQPPFNTDTVNNVATLRRPASLAMPQRGFVGGAQIGYNYQFKPGNGVVIGVEADAAYTGMRANASFLSSMGDPSTFRSRLDYLGTVRGRVGYALDRFMIYGTGGFAYGGVSNSVAFFSNAPGNALAYAGRSNRMETGYAVGGGMEYALPTDSFINVLNSSAVTLKAEYLYYDLGSRAVRVDATGLATANGSYTSRFKTEGHIVRAGLNFKFGSPIAPVVARY